MSRTLLVTAKTEGKVRAAIRAWRDSYILRKSAQMSLAWLGLAILSAGADPWSGKDVACLMVLIACSLWRR